ncbi:cytochrome P450 [Paenibacillus oleatilyticus]|uniref:cytochrome P450 n=1 Tax=Paenibacillus oleatilyticus TaxID=2594886 RepID=UPI001C1F9C7E|nr:cytochrome P450 [Paenibacillus oleatilyticus]MBU7318971.1 cytochrome P450 [Paenibacillus oleatilyticus]
MESAKELPKAIAPVKELSTKEAQIDPFPFFRQCRESAPVRYDPQRECWDIFRYEDVYNVLKDPTTFSSVRPIKGPVLLGSIIGMDPPKHMQMRGIVSKAFTPKSIEELGPRIASITEELLDAVANEGVTDLVHDLAVPLPVIVIAELLGIPAQDRRLFKEWSDSIVKGPQSGSKEDMLQLYLEREKTRHELDDYFLKVIAERRNRPEDDLVTKLVEAEVNGERLNDMEIVEFCILLLAAGNETTTNLITNSVRRLAEDPALQTRLHEQPALIESFVEEVLRYYPPVLSLSRYATKDVRIGHTNIREGELIIPWIGSANRDENKFPAADQFIEDRTPNPHMAFGFGNHFCLGAPLARLEAIIALRIIMNRMTNIRFAEHFAFKPIRSPFVYGVEELPILFDTKL